MGGQLKNAQKSLNTLYRSSYHSKWKSLHKFWVEWTQNADNLLSKYLENKNNPDLDEEEEQIQEFEDLTLEQEELLEDDTDDFLEKFGDVMQDLMTMGNTMHAQSVHGSN